MPVSQKGSGLEREKHDSLGCKDEKLDVHMKIGKTKEILQHKHFSSTCPTHHHPQINQLTPGEPW